ncbi:MAG: hypothetical protein V1891_04645 [bacterium]
MKIYELIKDWLLEFFRNKIIFPRSITCSLSKEKYNVKFENNRIIPYCPYLKDEYKCEVPITSADGVDKQNKKRKLRGNNGKCYITNKNYSPVCFWLIVLLILIVLLLCGICYASSRKESPIFSWRDETALDNNSKIITELKIFSEKRVTEADGPYCGFRFGKIYESNTKLFLSHDNEIVDTANLTNPELVLPEFSEKYLFYYKPYDIDGDGKEQEFVVQEYASCNGNLLGHTQFNQ